MKHTLKVTLILVLLFFISQVVGLIVINKDIKITKEIDGTIKTKHYSEKIIGPPPIKKSVGFIYIFSMILLGTIIFLILIKYRIRRLWKFWYLFAIISCLTIAFSVFITTFFAFILGLILSLLKIFKPNILLNNIIEIFIYSGIAVILVQWMNLFAGIMLLILISLYDMIAVWKTKHMVKMAKFQSKSKLFAGFFIPYEKVKGKGVQEKTKIPLDKKIPSVKKKVKIAILGGGDVAFPLIFSGIVMESLILNYGLLKLTAFLKTLIIPIFVSMALLWLLVKAEKDKFYPAMPFLSIGCLVGYVVVLFIGSL